MSSLRIEYGLGISIGMASPTRNPCPNIQLSPGAVVRAVQSILPCDLRKTEHQRQMHVGVVRIRDGRELFLGVGWQ